MGDGYNIFTQPTGPNIDVRLFGDAATRGAQLGKDIPNPITAGIQGVQEGIKNYQTQKLNEQKIESNQNELDNADLTTATKEEELAALQDRNDANAIKLKKDKALAELDTSTTTAKLRNEGVKANQESSIATQLQDLTQNFDSLDPTRQRESIFGGKSAQLWDVSPDTMYNLGKSIPNLNPQDQQELEYRGADARTRAQYDKQASESAQDYKDSRDVLIGQDTTGIVSKIANDMGKQPEYVFKNSKLVDAGLYKTDANGNVELDPNTGLPAMNAINAGGAHTAKSTFDMLYTDPTIPAGTPGSMKVIQSGFDKDFSKNFNAFQTNLSLVDGTQKNAAVNQLRQEHQNALKQLNQGQQTAGGISTLNKTKTSNTEATPAPKPLYAALAQDTLGLNEKFASDIEPSLKQISDVVQSEVKTTGKRADVGNIIQKNTLLNVLGQQVAKNDFENSPALQASISQSDVDKYNESIGGVYGGDKNSPYVQKMIAPYKVSSPAQLYYRNNQKSYDGKVTDYVNQLSDIYYRKLNASIIQKNSLSQFGANLK